MNKRMMEQVAALQTELSGWMRLTGDTAMAKLKQDPRDTGRWAGSALTIFSRWEVTVQNLRDSNDPDTASLLANLEQFDRKQVKEGIRAVLEIVLTKTAGETRTAIEAALSEAATFSRMVIDNAQRMENLRAAAEKAAGPFPGHTIKLSPEVRKAVECLTNRPRGGA